MIPMYKTEKEDKSTQKIGKMAYNGSNRAILPHDTPVNNFWIFTGVQVPINTRKYLGKGFTKFSALDKIWSYWSETAGVG